jgi:hypothetical protein
MLNVKNHSTNPHTEDDGGEEDFKMQHFELHVQHFDVPWLTRLLDLVHICDQRRHFQHFHLLLYVKA